MQTWSFEDSDLLVPLPESLLHNVDLKQLHSITQPVLDNIQYGTTNSTIPTNQSITTSQVKEYSESIVQGKSNDESQNKPSI